MLLLQLMRTEDEDVDDLDNKDNIVAGKITKKIHIRGISPTVTNLPRQRQSSVTLKGLVENGNTKNDVR